MTSRRIFASSLATLLGACAHATPVEPAPLSAQDGSSLQSALVGKCEVTATQEEGGERKKASGLTWKFAADGNATYAVLALGLVTKFTYRLDGRNVIMDGPYKTMRVDDWSGPTMKWFLYDISQTYYCTRK